MELHPAFLDRMRALLGAEFDQYLQAMQLPSQRGVRLNPLKCDLETLQNSVPYMLTQTPFSPLSFLAAGEQKPGTLAAHHAGMFYSQEPSAASAVTALDPQPGERVLDLCAAPGGKSTQIAGLLQNEGLLWSNEIVGSRATILASNLERIGARNAVVSNCHPQTLCETLSGYFDRVLVDAPCSGEGMFRRDPQAVAEWTPESPAACAVRQLAILDSAVRALRPGGVLVYSTCTFSEDENEGVVEKFLEAHPEFSVVSLESCGFGRPDLHGLGARRIFPMDGGEGHFVAKLQKADDAPDERKRLRSALPALQKKELEAVNALQDELFVTHFGEPAAQFGDRILLLPSDLPALKGLGVIRAGVELCEVRKNRLEPSHGIFMSRKREHCRRTIDFAPNDPQLAAFLRGEEIDCEEKGYTAVCVNGVVAGFGKASGGKLKNRYPKGLRNLK